MGAELVAVAVPPARNARPPTSQLLAELGETTDGPQTLGRLVASLGPRTHALAMLILALPDAVPLPIPSAGLIVGLPLLVVAGHLAIFGERSGLPAFVARRTVPATATAHIARYCVPVLRAIEKVAHRRLDAIGARHRLIGLVCLWLAFLLFLPLPFINFAPALCIIVIALGVLVGDGLLITAGFAATAILTAALVWLAGSLTAGINLMISLFYSIF